MVLEKKVNIKPINYAELNRLSKDFGKRFVPQKELSDEQAFQLQTTHPNTDQSASSPVKIEAPQELPKKGNGGELKGSIGNEKLDVLFGSIDQRGVAIVREGTATRVNLDESGATCDGNPKVISSPLVSPTAILIMPLRGPYDIDVAATFRVPLTTVGDLHMLINDIEAGKHDELLSEMTNDDRMETLDALGTICNSIQDDRNVILNESYSMPKGVPSVKAPNDPNADDNMSGMVSPSDPIVHSVDINTKSTSYAGAAGASAKDQPKVNSNFRPLVADPVFDGVNISIPRKVVEKVSTRFEHTLYGYFIGKRMAFPVVEYYARNNWAKHGLKRIMMNNKGFFFFKFDSRAGLEVVLEGGPWLILFEEDGISLIATFIGKPVMLDSYTSSMCNDSWGRSSFARCLIEVSSEVDLVDVVTIGIPSLIGEDFTKETIRVEYEWRPPRCDVCKIFGHVHDQCPKKVVTSPIVSTSPIFTPTVEKTNDGFHTVGKKKKRKGKSKSNNGGQFAGPSVKQIVRYEPKATPNTPKKGATNKEEDEEEEVENVYDETANLFIKTGGSSFTAAAG
ncbi:zinc knuckle CX2CX4HX4C containing protein [Tanacetum coccineum]